MRPRAGLPSQAAGDLDTGESLVPIASEGALLQAPTAGGRVSLLMIRLGDWDRRLLRVLVLRRHPVLDRLMRAVTHLADPILAIPIGVTLALGLLPVPPVVGREALITLALSHGLVQILKRWISRPRPHLTVGPAALIEMPGCFSFPSGHATAALALALPVALVLPPAVGVGVLALGLLVGASRIYLGVHYPGDVLAGWSLAVVTLLMVHALFPRR